MFEDSCMSTSIMETQSDGHNANNTTDSSEVSDIDNAPAAAYDARRKLNPEPSSSTSAALHSPTAGIVDILDEPRDSDEEEEEEEDDVEEEVGRQQKQKQQQQQPKQQQQQQQEPQAQEPPPTQQQQNQQQDTDVVEQEIQDQRVQEAEGNGEQRVGRPDGNENMSSVDQEIRNCQHEINMAMGALENLRKVSFCNI